eukprot:2408454-Amphidinium_carterae.1
MLKAGWAAGEEDRDVSSLQTCLAHLKYHESPPHTANHLEALDLVALECLLDASDLSVLMKDETSLATCSLAAAVFERKELLVERCASGDSAWCLQLCFRPSGAADRRKDD